MVVDRDSIAITSRPLRIRFRSVDGPEAVLRLAEELWPGILGILKVVFGVEIDRETMVAAGRTYLHPNPWR